MRIVAIVLGGALLAGSASAQVKLVVKSDGTKVIYNITRTGGYHGSDLTWLAARHDRRTRFDAAIERYATQYGVDPVLVRAVIQVESDFDPLCVSRKGARGLMQLMPETAKRYGVKNVHDPEQNIHGGVHYLADLLKMFPRDLSRVLAAYNAGENAVLKYAGIPPYEETGMYVKRALTVYYGKPYGSGAYSYAGRRGGTKLRGGFSSTVIPPVVASMLPGMKYLGSQ
jgi:soluble lytic murein transglycosylase-like protein